MDGFGQLLAEHLRIRGWSQRAFAARIGRTPAYISKVVRGERAIPYEGIEGWADALGLAGPEREAFLLAGDLTRASPRVRTLVRELTTRYRPSP